MEKIYAVKIPLEIVETPREIICDLCNDTLYSPEEKKKDKTFYAIIFEKTVTQHT